MTKVLIKLVVVIIFWVLLSELMSYLYLYEINRKLKSFKQKKFRKKRLNKSLCFFLILKRSCARRKYFWKRKLFPIKKLIHIMAPKIIKSHIDVNIIFFVFNYFLYLIKTSIFFRFSSVLKVIKNQFNLNLIVGFFFAPLFFWVLH